MSAEPSTDAQDLEFARPSRAWRAAIADYAGLTLALAGLITVFSLSAPRFFSLTTFRTIANQIPDAVTLAVGMTLVMIAGGIDLSVGSVMALGAAALGLCLVDLGLPLPLAIVVCMLTGLACGAVNGAIMIKWKLPSFIVTLGMLEMARGGAYLATHSQTRYLGSAVERLTEISLHGISLPFALALTLVIGGQFVLARTVFGRYLVAIGTNEEATRLAGVDVRPVKLLVFALSGLLAALAAIIHSGRLSAADPNAGTGFELQAIAACVIGGTSLSGGRGSVVRSFFGVMIIASLGAGLSQLGAQEPTKRLVTGGVIVGAMILDTYRARFGKK